MQERKRLDVTVVYLHQAFISFVVLYKRGFVMFGVVSLTMGNSRFIIGNSLTAYEQFFPKLVLSHSIFIAHISNVFSYVSHNKHLTIVLWNCFVYILNCTLNFFVSHAKYLCEGKIQGFFGGLKI